MATQNKAWDQVSEKFDSLGTRLRSHFTDVSSEAATDRLAFEKSVRALLDALEETLNAAGKTVRDPALRNDLTDLVATVRAALVATVETASDQVRERISGPVRRGREIAGKTGLGKSVTGKAASHKADVSKTPAKAAKPKRVTD